MRDRKRSEICNRKAGHSFVTPRIPPTVDHAISQATFLVRNLVSFLAPPHRNQHLQRPHRSRRLASPRPPSPTSGAAARRCLRLRKAIYGSDKQAGPPRQTSRPRFFERYLSLVRALEKRRARQSRRPPSRLTGRTPARPSTHGRPTTSAINCQRQAVGCFQRRGAPTLGERFQERGARGLLNACLVRRVIDRRSASKTWRPKMFEIGAVAD